MSGMDVNSVFFKNGWDAGRADADEEIKRLTKELQYLLMASSEGAKEVERLREIAKDKLLWESVAAKAMKRIEELESCQHHNWATIHPSKVAIDRKQIDAAWKILHGAAWPKEVVSGMESILSLFGIERDGNGWKIGGGDE